MGETDSIPKTPEWGEKITGIPADTIRELAIRYATTKPAAIIQGYGAQRNAYGEQSARGAILLACLTGNVASAVVLQPVPVTVPPMNCRDFRSLIILITEHCQFSSGLMQWIMVKA